MSMKSRDRYPEIGKKFRFKGMLEDVLLLVRETYPTAFKEGSTGYEYTFYIKTDNDPELIGHAWSRDNENWWVRITK